MFAKYFFEVENALSHHDREGQGRGPRYLQLIILLCMHTFIREGVDTAIIETHHGGEYDSTNFVEKPIVTAITTLGLDHIKQLGSSLESIAWHKGGIFKRGATVFSAPQETEAANMLRKRASDLKVNLEFIDVESTLDDHTMQLKPEVQRTNSSVALAVARSFLDQTTGQNSTLTLSDVDQGIKQFSWPGRFQTFDQNKFQWFLDSAHNEMSIVIAADWFKEVCEDRK